MMICLMLLFDWDYENCFLLFCWTKNPYANQQTPTKSIDNNGCGGDGGRDKSGGDSYVEEA